MRTISGARMCRPADIVVSGNTGIDALKWLVRRLGEDAALRSRAQAMLDATGVPCLQGRERRADCSHHRASA